MRLAILSDTHGLLRPQVLPYLAGIDHILHAGDLGSDVILATLRTYAPVTAIRGNIDHDGLCAQLPATELVDLAGKLFYLIHSLRDLDLNPAVAGISAVITGHSHQARIDHKNGVLYLNPGSCGPSRFSLPITLALMDTDTMQPALIPLL